MKYIIKIKNYNRNIGMRKRQAKINPVPEVVPLNDEPKEVLDRFEYIEENKYFTYGQIESRCFDLQLKMDTICSDIKRYEETILFYINLTKIPEQIVELENKITRSLGDPYYKKTWYKNKKAQLENYKETVRKYDLDSPEGMELINKKITDEMTKKNKSEIMLAEIKNKLLQTPSPYASIIRNESKSNNKANEMKEVLADNHY